MNVLVSYLSCICLSLVLWFWITQHGGSSIVTLATAQICLRPFKSFNFATQMTGPNESNQFHQYHVAAWLTDESEGKLVNTLLHCIRRKQKLYPTPQIPAQRIRRNTHSNSQVRWASNNRNQHEWGSAEEYVMALCDLSENYEYTIMTRSHMGREIHPPQLISITKKWITDSIVYMY